MVGDDRGEYRVLALFPPFLAHSCGDVAKDDDRSQELAVALDRLAGAGSGKTGPVLAPEDRIVFPSHRGQLRGARRGASTVARPDATHKHMFRFAKNLLSCPACHPDRGRIDKGGSPLRIRGVYARLQQQAIHFVYAERRLIRLLMIAVSSTTSASSRDFFTELATEDAACALSIVASSSPGLGTLTVDAYSGHRRNRKGLRFPNKSGNERQIPDVVELSGAF